MAENKFNLADEPWIPVAEKGKVNLRQIFSETSITSLGGNPVEKISVFKLLLAIAQSACTPETEDDWKKLGCSGIRQKVDAYLTEHHDCFWLYGEKPFLQMPAIAKAELASYGDVKMEVSTGNTSVVTEIQSEKPLDDSEKALLVIVLMGFAFGGKKVDNSVVLTPGYSLKSNDKGKPASGKPGTSLGFMGYTHSFLFANSIADSVYENIFTADMIKEMNMFPSGLGVAPWLGMPAGEDDAIAKKLKTSYMGRLLPLSRFMLLSEKGLVYSEGISHPGYVDFVVDPSVTVDFMAKPKPKLLWIDPERKPWRQLTSLLAFLDSTNANKFVCYQLKEMLHRFAKLRSFTIWSGGVRVSSNAGEQYLTGTDDFVESEIQLSSDIFSDEHDFFGTLSTQMEYLEKNANMLFGCVTHYYKSLKTDGKSIAAQATNTYWQLCETKFQQLVTACAEDLSGDKARAMHKVFNSFVMQIYDEACPKDSARQLEAWAENKPFMKKEKEEAEENE